MNRIPLYLLALIVAIANSPTNVYQICAWNVGTLEVEPWRSKRTAFAVPLRKLRTAIRAIFNACGGLPAAAALAVALVVMLTVPAAHAGVLTAIAPVGLKAFRQREAELKADILKAKKDKAAIGATVLAEKREMTDKERADYLAFPAQIEQLEASLAQNAEFLADAEAANEADRTFDAGRVNPDADAEATRAAAANSGVRGDQLALGESAEEKAMKAPGFFGRALQAVRRVAIKDAHAGDDKLIRMMAGPTGANTDVPSDGGFLVAPERANTIIQRMYDTGEIASLVNRMPVSGNGIVLPAVDETSRADGSRFGGIASGWLGQGNGLTSGKPKFRAMELKLRKVGAFVYGTDELIADAVAFEAFVNKNVPQELTFRSEDAFINGDGSNKPAGVLNSGAAVTVTRNTASRVLYEDVSAMWARMWAPLRKGAVWIIDQSVEQQLEQLSIAIGTAGVLAPIYRPAGISVGPNGTQGYSPATLYGRPVLTTEYNAALGTVGDIILTNMGEYTVIDKGGVDQAVSLHVAFLTDESVYRFMYRVDGQLNWNAALTPKSGGSTLSPVVTLT